MLHFWKVFESIMPQSSEHEEFLKIIDGKATYHSLANTTQEDAPESTTNVSLESKNAPKQLHASFYIV